MVEEIDDLFPMEKLAAELSRPMLILHGMLDTVGPYQVSLTFMEQAVCPHIELRLFKDGDHRLYIVRGWWRGEPFFHGLPSSYWQNAIHR